jgi:hypothetical protein
MYFANCSYSLRPLLPIADVDVSRHILESRYIILETSSSGRREYIDYLPYACLFSTLYSGNTCCICEVHIMLSASEI